MDNDPIYGNHVEGPSAWARPVEPQRVRVTTPLTGPAPLPPAVAYSLPLPMPPAASPTVLRPVGPVRRGVSGMLLGAVLLLGLIAGGIGGSVSALLFSKAAPAAVITAPAPTTSTGVGTGQSVTRTQSAISQIYKNVAGAVVQVQVAVNGPGPMGGEGEGTGIVLDKEGHILTNNHVVENATEVRVLLLDGTQITAKVVGTAPQDDLAIIQADIPADKLVVAPLGSSAGVLPGDTVIAIGNPFGLDHTVTAGIISAVGRDYSPNNARTLRGMLQTDAAINPGNSGGPLLNDQGQVIGINTAIESPVGASVGIGFAIPIDRAKTLLPQLQSGGKVQRPWLGIRGGGITARLAQQLSLPVQKGILLSEVVADSPAQKAGLQGVAIETATAQHYGDIITAVDGKVLSDVPDLIGYLDNKTVGDKVSLTILRAGKEQKVDLTLEAWRDVAP